MEIKQIFGLSIGLLMVTIILISGCAKSENTQIANPASVYCEENGGELEIVTAADGSQSGNCKFPDGKVCEEWAYFRGECPAK